MRAAEKLGKKLDVLIEINVGGETAKSGLAPDSTTWRISWSLLRDSIISNSAG